MPTSTHPTAITVSAKDLNSWGGIHCPSPLAQMAVASNHPKVFINVAHTGEGKCPYCGTVYRLKEGEAVKGGGH